MATTTSRRPLRFRGSAAPPAAPAPRPSSPPPPPSTRRLRRPAPRPSLLLFLLLLPACAAVSLASPPPIEAIPSDEGGCDGDGDGGGGGTTCAASNAASAPGTDGGGTGGFGASPALAPGEVAPLRRRDGEEVASGKAFQVGLPPELTEALLEYCDETGIADLMRKLTSTDPLPPAEDGGGAYQFARGDDEEASWIVHRPVVTDEEGGDFHLIYPADERTHESYLRVLAGGGLDVVLTSLGEALGVDSLAAYQVGFEGMSNGARDSERNVFVNELTVPLVLDRDVPPELIPRDDRPGGAYRYRVGTGVVAGGNASNRTRGGMRLAATVHLAAISSHNAAAVSASMTRIFPARNVEWLLAQEARHWRRGGRRGGSLSNGTVGDRGRRAFRAGDEDGEECAKLAKRGLCETDPEGTRGRCPFSCEVYVLDGPVAVGGVDDAVGVCVQNRTGLEECRTFEDDPSIPGDFVAPHLEPGEMFPMLWREDRERVAPYAFQVGLPPELTSALLEYADDTGIADEMRRLTGDAPLRPIEGEDALRFQEFEDGTRWYVQRPPAKWQSNMHWISPADERTHEEYLKVLARGDFDLVLDAVGSYLGLKSLVAYHLTFIGVSHSVRGFVHWDSQRTGASVYNVIVPLILADDGAPELRMTDFHDASEAGLLKYRAGTAALMGDDAMHATEACDYRPQGCASRRRCTSRTCTTGTSTISRTRR